MQENGILKMLPGSIRMAVKEEHLQYEYLQEIKLRAGQPLILVYRGEEVMPKRVRTNRISSRRRK